MGKTEWGVALLLAICIFTIGGMLGMEIAFRLTDRHIRTWAIEQEYGQYNPKTGEFEFLDEKFNGLRR